MSEEEQTAVVDRVVGDDAVLLVGPDEREVTLPVAQLPAGSAAGDWLLVRVRTSLEVIGPAEPEVDEDGLAGRLSELKRQRSRRFGH